MGKLSFTITSKTSRKFYKKTRKVKDLDNEKFKSLKEMGEDTRICK